MKSANAAMDSLLATRGPFFIADCYNIGGSRWTDCDRDVQYSTQPNTKYSKGPVLSRSKTRLVLGLESSTMTITISDPGTTTVNGIPLIKALRQGQFDGATVFINRIIASSYETILSGGARTIQMFSGIVSDVEVADLTATITVVSKAYLFDQTYPNDTYAPGCVRTLFDSGCTVLKSAFERLGTVVTASSNSVFTSGLFDADDYYSLGTMVFTSGANNGLTRTIRYSKSTGEIAVSLPFPVQPSTGDTFKIYPGCDKLKSTCNSKFGNEANFKGFPYVPNPESLA